MPWLAYFTVTGIITCSYRFRTNKWSSAKEKGHSPPDRNKLYFPGASQPVAPGVVPTVRWVADKDPPPRARRGWLRQAQQARPIFKSAPICRCSYSRQLRQKMKDALKQSILRGSMPRPRACSAIIYIYVCKQAMPYSSCSISDG